MSELMKLLTGNNNNNNVKKTCRLCLVSDTDDTFTNMFTFSSKLGVLIADVVMKCTTIHVIQEDDMPDSICGLCYTEVERIHQFQRRAVQSDKTLRRRLQQQQSATSIRRFRKTKKTSAEVTVKSENILEQKDFYQLNVKEENPSEVSEDDKNTSVDQVFKIESEFIIKEESINDIEMDTNNEEGIVNDNEETRFDFLEPNDNINSEQIENSVPHFDIIEPFSEFRENKDMVKSYECHNCKKCFHNIYQLRKHRLTHPSNKKGRFPCDICKRVFKFRNRLVFHRFSHDKEQNCDVCDERFKSQYLLKVHKLTHAGEQPHRCSLCNKTFKGSSPLKNHMLWHTGDKPPRCHICDNQFRHPYNLKLHLSLIHGT